MHIDRRVKVLEDIVYGFMGERLLIYMSVIVARTPLATFYQIEEFGIMKARKPLHCCLDCRPHHYIAAAKLKSVNLWSG